MICSGYVRGFTSVQHPTGILNSSRSLLAGRAFQSSAGPCLAKQFCRVKSQIPRIGYLNEKVIRPSRPDFSGKPTICSFSSKSGRDDLITFSVQKPRRGNQKDAYEQQSQVFIYDGKTELLSKRELDYLEKGKDYDISATDIGWIGFINGTATEFEECVKIVAQRKGVSPDTLSDEKGLCLDFEVAYEITNARLKKTYQDIKAKHVLPVPYSVYLDLRNKLGSWQTPQIVEL